MRGSFGFGSYGSSGGAIVDELATYEIKELLERLAAELFDAELSKVIANIQDNRADWKKPRSIMLEVTFLPNVRRRVGDLSIVCTSELVELTSYVRIERISESVES